MKVSRWDGYTITNDDGTSAEYAPFGKEASIKPSELYSEGEFLCSDASDDIWEHHVYRYKGELCVAIFNMHPHRARIYQLRKVE